ncbi:cryptochrome/photolyase family protein [Polymorphum gilvum]|uniref:Deoxyribodipyrimidine photo-lyase n=1 Tax=Polymorphum gilvum (strain LMG 25793 / CGMCC 1.9160 / SL003B-26A1) TaxID=991905 RepID=F2J5X8_POLGS|nr:deoxyribodipyrimidine photo-lyase [Polymorphum gilvum]ADZ71232.1 Deoxyribodipyrimidine photolyase family [Polymorphum gilvum SL003B-26A1]
MTTLVWFRQDLRIADNPALFEAAARGSVLPVFVLDEGPGDNTHPLGAASRWWLHHSLEALARDLGRLVLLHGDPQRLIPELARAAGVGAVHWNRCYEPHAVRRDTALKAALIAAGVEVRSFNAALLNEPWELETKTGGPFKVFSPYWRAALARPVATPLPRPPRLEIAAGQAGDRLDDWRLRPTAPDWAAGWRDLWHPGEAGAAERLEHFLEAGLDGYATLRDRPDLSHVSRLSPHLHFGEVSPRQVVARTRFAAGRTPGLERDADKFLAEIGWREFSHHLLYHFPRLPERNWKSTFDAYPWRDSSGDLAVWQRGQTGYPMVDAGMRELWATGYMHNRVRMLAASFLVKHLRLDWRLGEAWFRDTLVDADLANNAAGWQWVAGSGADAAPYFRIFSPVGQGRRFDPGGAYVRRWCPELARLPDDHVHAPFDAPAVVLKAAGVELGRTYPHPIVDHAAARAEALAGYEAVRRAGEAGAEGG